MTIDILIGINKLQRPVRYMHKMRCAFISVMVYEVTFKLLSENPVSSVWRVYALLMGMSLQKTYR